MAITINVTKRNGEKIHAAFLDIHKCHKWLVLFFEDIDSITVADTKKKMRKTFTGKREFNEWYDNQ